MQFSQSSTHSLILYHEKYTDIQWRFMTKNLTKGSLDYTTTQGNALTKRLNC